MAKSKKREVWSDEVGWASDICRHLGCTVEQSTAMYEIAKVKGDGVSLVIYPHKTSAGNYHARVRNNGSKNPDKAAEVMTALNHGAGLPQQLSDRIRFSCTFTSRNGPL